ncbi:12-oxophytodienoate reductase [Rhizobium sp. CF080]|uniref:alkene reductase n=1 Tax=Rhizobium sp. (strain CF080) TaxID=1144310 RepID=UPI000271D679|nr:alkene reductase [Rhizobium sp. CF080]EUB99267.1 12-oxophytodienoate reductase [Rhizobium sp. CF080]
MTLLFEPYDLAGLPLANRIVMAPMTRARALDNIPDDQTALYYAQRANAGLIVSEGAPISKEGQGYLFNPSLYTKEQAEGWRKVTAAVHEKGGKIFAQLWHVGRVSHVFLQPDGGAPVSSTSTRAENSQAYAFGEDGKPQNVRTSTPRALQTDEIARVSHDFVAAARLAIEAGFDGIEIHGANGYIFEQFINGAVNDRTDRYGGSIENRLRFLLETVDAVCGAIGSNRVSVRISPFGRLNDMRPYADEAETWLSVARELDARKLAYVHLSDQITMGLEGIPADFPENFCRLYHGTLIAAGGFDRDTGEEALQKGHLSLIGIGRPFISNPDLVERLKNGWPLAEPDRETLYGQWGARGYTDYPTYQAERG